MQECLHAATRDSQTDTGSSSSSFRMAVAVFYQICLRLQNTTNCRKNAEFVNWRERRGTGNNKQWIILIRTALSLGQDQQQQWDFHRSACNVIIWMGCGTGGKRDNADSKWDSGKGCHAATGSTKPTEFDSIQHFVYLCPESVCRQHTGSWGLEDRAKPQGEG